MSFKKIGVQSENFIPVHGASKKGVMDNLNEIFENVKVGSVVGGDFNINFLLSKNIKALKKFLIDKKWKIEISGINIDLIQVFFKMRSANSLFSQQLLKNGEPDIFVKDLMFKVGELKEGEECFPSQLEKKLQELNQKYQCMLDKINESSIIDEMHYSKLATELGIKSYHDFSTSHGDDHPSTYFIDITNKIIYFAKNSPAHKDYHLNEHLNDRARNKPIEEIAKIYQGYTEVVFEAAYTLLRKKEKEPLSGSQESVNPKDIERFVKESLSNDTNMGSILPEDLRAFFKTVLYSREFSEVNAQLKTPFTELEDIINRLTSSENIINVYTKRLDKALTALFQALSPDLPKKEQTISLSGTGFKPFLDEHGIIIPAYTVEKEQIRHEIEELNSLAFAYPGYQFAVAQIEAEGQDAKTKAILTAVTTLNNIAQASRVPKIDAVMHDNTGNSKVSFFNSKQKENLYLKEGKKDSPSCCHLI